MVQPFKNKKLKLSVQLNKVKFMQFQKTSDCFGPNSFSENYFSISRQFEKCICKFLLIRIDFPHVCVKFTQLNSANSCVKQIERVSFISFLIWNGLKCFKLASKLIKPVSLLERSLLLIQFTNSTKINLCLKHFVKTRYFVIANLLPNIKASYVLRKYNTELRKYSSILDARVSTYVQSAVRNLFLVM